MKSTMIPHIKCIYSLICSQLLSRVSFGAVQWTFLFMLTSFMGFSQNLIVNPDFESGSIPTDMGQITHATGWSQPCMDAYIFTSGGDGADLFDRNSLNPGAQVPFNGYTYGFELEEIDGDDRYAHLWQTENAFTGSGGAAELKGERITGTLTETLEAGCYNLCFWAAVMPHDATIQPGVYVDFNPLLPWDLSKQIVEVLLVDGNDCDGLLIYESPTVPDDSVWHQYCVNFTLPPSDAGMFDHILFRIKSDGNANGNQFSIFIDSTALYDQSAPVTISGDTHFCSGQTTLLTVEEYYDHYLWSNGATTPSISVGTSGTYTVTAWNDGDECQASASFTVTEVPLPKIPLPDEVFFCNGNFVGICGPSSTTLYSFSYSWYFNDPISQTSYLVSNGMCFIPSQYGSYTLVVENQYGCSSSHTINVLESFGPSVHIEDVYYCKGLPLSIGLPGPYADALSYTWTYDNGSGATPIAGATGYQVPYMGDGEYCVMIQWSGGVFTKKGCSSTACFTVMYCCDPVADFILTYDATGSTSTITVENNPSNTLHYASEQFALYQYCGPVTDLNLISWTLLTSTTWNTDFNTPVVFSGLNKNCIYKVSHRVQKKCPKPGKTIVSEQLAGLLKVQIYPNPLVAEGAVTIEMVRPSLDATVEIRHAATGRFLYEGQLLYGKPLKISKRLFEGQQGIYLVKVTNAYGSTSEKLIVR
ncbi:MAG: T9SS type A sorting domain-containing protein [Bacteroidota bacterium]